MYEPDYNSMQSTFENPHPRPTYKVPPQLDYIRSNMQHAGSF